jgi:hypothetical protein
MAITITILEITHRPVYYLKHSVSETGFCSRLQVEPTKLGPTDSANLLYPDRGHNPVSETLCFRKGQEGG